MQDGAGLGNVQAFGCQGSNRGLLGGADRAVTGLLNALLVGCGQRFAGNGIGTGSQRDFGFRLLGQRPGLFRGVFGKLDNRLDHRLERRVTEGDGAEHHVFRKLFGFGFDHQHALLGAGDDQFQYAGLRGRHGGIQHERAVLVTDAGRSDRAEKRNAGQGQRGGAADHRNDVGIVLHVMAEHGGDDLHFVAEAFGEQRADRAVDQAAFQHLGLRRPAFALEEAAGDLTGREGLFLVVDGQREEVLPRLRGFDAHGGTQHNGLAIADHHGAVGLAGDLTGFEDELAAAPFDFLAEVVEHAFVLWMRWQCGRQAGRSDRSLGGREAASRVTRSAATPLRRSRARVPCGRKRRRGSRSLRGRAGSAGLTLRRCSRRCPESRRLGGYSVAATPIWERLRLCHLSVCLNRHCSLAGNGRARPAMTVQAITDAGRGGRSARYSGRGSCP